MPERRQACSLLGWLALHQGMHPRSEVAGRFWPDVLDSSARKSLRTELVAIRRALGAAGEGALVATRDLVGFAGEGVFVDAWEFERLVREGRLRRGRRSLRRGAAPGDSTPTGSTRPASRTAAAWRRARAPGRGRRSRRRARGRDSHLASPRRARSAPGGRPPRARPAPDRGGRDLRRARGVRRPRSAPQGRAAAWRRRETRRLLEAIHAHDDARPRSQPRRRRRFPRPWRGDGAARSSVARTRCAGSRRSGPKLSAESGRLALIAGEPGFGKTRLASEFARAAHEEGAAVLLGRCHEEMLISYQPFVEAFGRYVAAVSPEVLRGQVGMLRGRARAAGPRARAAAPGPRRAGRRRLGGPSASASSRPPAPCSPTRRDRGRSCCVLEDLHWADKPTALLLAHIVRAIQADRVLVLGTYRDTELGEPLVSRARRPAPRPGARAACGCGASTAATSPR